MDPATWRAIAQIAMLCGLCLVAGGMLVGYVAGNRLEAAREREARARHTELEERLAGLGARQAAPAAREAPPESRAAQEPARIEEPPKKLRDERPVAADVLTPSAAPAGMAQAEDEVVRRLRALVQRGEMPVVTVNVSNLSTTSIRHVFVALIQALKKAGAPYRVGSMVETPAADAPEAPYRVVARTGDEDSARRIVTALHPFLRSDPVLASDATIVNGIVVVDLQPQAVDFHGDGSVDLR